MPTNTLRGDAARRAGYHGAQVKSIPRATAFDGNERRVAPQALEPEEVARVMEFLTSEENLSEFYARTLFIPGHLGLAESGVDFDVELPQALNSLNTFAAEVGKLQPLAYDLQAYPYNTILFNAARDRLSQVFAGELTLDDAIAQMQEDIDTGIAAAQQAVSPIPLVQFQRTLRRSMSCVHARQTHRALWLDPPCADNRPVKKTSASRSFSNAQKRLLRPVHPAQVFRYRHKT